MAFTGMLMAFTVHTKFGTIRDVALFVVCSIRFRVQLSELFMSL